MLEHYRTCQSVAACALRVSTQTNIEGLLDHPQGTSLSERGDYYPVTSESAILGSMTTATVT